MGGCRHWSAQRICRIAQRVAWTTWVHIWMTVPQPELKDSYQKRWEISTPFWRSTPECSYNPQQVVEILLSEVDETAVGNLIGRAMSGRTCLVPFNWKP